jgi:hypothetical protein
MQAAKTPPWGDRGGVSAARYAKESLPISPIRALTKSLDAPLAEQARNRDHHSGDPCGQASKQQKVAILAPPRYLPCAAPYWHSTVMPFVRCRTLERHELLRACAGALGAL